MTHQDQDGFTLIELLVVIAIIAVLLGFIFPVFQGVQDRAKKVQAKNDLTQIVTAVNAFYTEYGRYPTSSTSDITFGYGGTKSDTLFFELRGLGGSSINTRLIQFISPAEDTNQTNPKGKIGSDGQFCDPWGTTYKIAVDATYDSQIANPYGNNNGAGPDPLRQGVTSWSYGKDTKAGNNGDNKFTNSDDVISWQ